MGSEPRGVLAARRGRAASGPDTETCADVEPRRVAAPGETETSPLGRPMKMATSLLARAGPALCGRALTANPGGAGWRKRASA